MRLHKYNLGVGCAVALVLTFGACLQPPDYPDEPVLTFAGLTRDSMVQGAVSQDSISVVLSFTDGDGDIGFGDTAQNGNLFIENRKTGDQVANFKIDEIPDNGLKNGISGEIRLRLYTTCCDYPSSIQNAPLPCTPFAGYPVDTLLLEAYLIDRAGNESNRVDIAPVYLLCDRI